MRVFGARCLVKEEKLSDKTTTGIIIPGRDKIPTNRGEVVSIGDGVLLENGTKVPMQVKVGDIIFYASFAGQPISTGKKDSEVFIVLNERDILAALDEEEVGDNENS